MMEGEACPLHLCKSYWSGAGATKKLFCVWHISYENRTVSEGVLAEPYSKSPLRSSIQTPQKLFFMTIRPWDHKTPRDTMSHGEEMDCETPSFATFAVVFHLVWINPSIFSFSDPGVSYLSKNFGISSLEWKNLKSEEPWSQPGNQKGQ